ncbi:aspartate carbamoyltransferase catalytic subunit [Hippea maritima]|uniref:Aspartate carbamoyltransferase n=1 Tax=Hippea maritima (strain ATCC 700847 / DSM 10411 / MH2) TaxID=760142 RepID=F2LUE6_HIPMA|nr:aspartate carbamoyltransferase catalytic subunit [Hippea maritima]AEA33472.1 Aspartate carbamoyltransferase [Hippea maritima DSM 10411]
MKHFVSIKDLSKENIELIIKRALKFKESNLFKGKLKDKTIVTLFFENSTRTRTSFEIAAKNMGAEVVNIDHNQSSLKKGETDYDTIINLSAMRPDAFVIRHYQSGYPEFLSKFTNIPVINAGDGTNEHPSQAILDAITMFEAKGKLDNLNVCIIGDISNSRVAKSHMWMAKLFDWKLSFYGPKTMLPKQEWLDGVKIEPNLQEALSDKDFIILLRIQLERKSGQNIPSLKEYSRFFGIGEKNMPNAYIMHPGPVNRNVELSSALMDKHEKILITKQVENGVFARMAIFEFCLL